MRKSIFLLLAFATLSIFTSCKKDVVRGTQVPKDVIEVEGVGKIGRMAKFYDFSKEFLACWDEGFTDREDFGRWCVGEKGFLVFQVRKNAAVTMRLDLVAFITDSHKENRIRVVTNGVECGEIVLTESKPVFLNLNEEHITSNNTIELELYPVNAKSPQELGISEDTRKIGFGLRSITLWAYYPVE